MQPAEQTERFLDDLVADTVKIRALLAAPMQYDYISETLSSKAPLELLENGRLYVVTPSCGFEYRLHDGKIYEPMPIEIFHVSRRRPGRKNQIDYSESRDLWDLKEVVQSMKRQGDGTSPVGAQQHRILFFNPVSKANFDKVKGEYLIQAGVFGLDIPSYGRVNCYTYI